MIYAEFKEVTIRLNMLDLEFMKSGIQPNDTVILPTDGLPLAVPELPDTPTIQLYAETFLEYRRNTVRNSSYQRYVRCLKSKILPYFGDMRLNAVNGKTVQNFVNTMLRNGMAVKSIKYCVGLLKSIFRCAEMEGINKLKKSLDSPMMNEEKDTAQSRIRMLEAECQEMYLTIYEMKAR